MALFPGHEAKITFVTLLNELLPTGLRGLVLAALLAAMISSLLSMMNSISTLVTKDYVVRLRPHTSERAQVRIGRLAIVLGTACGILATYPIAMTPEGLYKYLQTVSLFLVMPLTPAIFFGIMSRRVTFTGAVWSFAIGVMLAGVFVTDQLMGREWGMRVWPCLHLPLTENYTYRGLWGTALITLVLFLVSFVTRKTSEEKLARTTVCWERLAPFEGWKDWRLQWAVLALVTISLYVWLW